MTHWLADPVGGMDLDRADLKQTLYRMLACPRLYQGRYQHLTQCQLCGAPFAPGGIMPALHELVLERDDVMGCPQAVQYSVLHTPLNLTLLCNDPCNIKLAKDDLLRDHLLARQIERYGLGPIVAWLARLDLVAPAVYRLRLERLAQECRPQGRERLTSTSYLHRRRIREQLVRERLLSYGRRPLF